MSFTAVAPPVERLNQKFFPAQGQWTYQDYLRLPEDDKRYEIIHGVLYMANAPGYDHQYTVSKLHLRLGLFVEDRQLGEVLTAPFEIHLSDLAKPVQPDVFFISQAQSLKRGDKIFTGAPELTIEVISPSSERTDRVVKFAAYEQARVREYWLVDPARRLVDVYTLTGTPPEYMLHGQFRPGGKPLSSMILPELTLIVDSLFLPG